MCHSDTHPVHTLRFRCSGPNETVNVSFDCKDCVWWVSNPRTAFTDPENYVRGGSNTWNLPRDVIFPKGKTVQLHIKAGCAQSARFQRVSVLLNHKVPRPCQVDSNHPHIHPVQSTTYKLKLHRFAHWYEDADALAAFGALSSWCSTGVVFFFHTMNVFSALVDSQKQMQFLQLVEQLKPPEPFASFVHDVGGLSV